jgi:hypothetical protein
LARDGFLRAFAVLRRTSVERATAPVLPNDGLQPKTGKRRAASAFQLAWVAVCLAMMLSPAKFSFLRILVPVLLLGMSVILWQRHDRSAIEVSRT